MPHHRDRVGWMPSPPLAPDGGPIDSDHLQSVPLGDASLEREVLAMFSGQAMRLMRELAASSSDRRALVHMLKGSARAIGAFRVGEAAELLEAVLRQGE